MQRAKPRPISGFTIVELLVVIVVIGVLAAITIVSYSGIKTKAIAASLQSDLSSSAQKLKLYYTEYGTYPSTLNASNCPTTPTADSKYCLKASSGNTLTYCPVTPYSSFTLKAINTSGTGYVVTDSSSPQTSAASYVFSSGGTVTSDSCNRTHTFAPGTYNLTAANAGSITINIAGGGGGGNGLNYDDCSVPMLGVDGNLSQIVTNSTTYAALAGLRAPCYSGGAAGGVNFPGGFVNTASPAVGGGGAGGIGTPWDGDDLSGGGTNGGAGGRVTGSISVSTGQTFVLTVGAGGAGGCYHTCGGAGGNGSIVIRYQY